MRVLRVRHHSAFITVRFRLKRFVADWPTAQQRFIGGIADRFQSWVTIGPQNFSVTPAFSLGDLRCRCQLFGDACSIDLTPDALRLSFTNVKSADRPIVMRTIRICSEWLSSVLGDHGRDWLVVDTAAHLQALEDGAADAYLGQFISEEIADTVKSESDVKYLPSMRMDLSDENGGWVLRRTVEKSEAVENGVFVNTMVHIASPDPADFEAHEQLLDRADRLADRFVGLQCEDM